MKGLVEGECGGSNPLMRLTTHYTQDKGHVDDGVRIRGILGNQTLTENGLVQEFLSETHQVTSRPPQTFRMDSLLQEMRDIEGPRSLGAVPRQAPAVADLATTGETWAAEYLDTEQNVIDWSREYLKENSLGGPDPLNHSEGFVRNQNAAPKWAEEYLTDLPVIDQNISALEDVPTLDPQEFEDFIASVGKEAKSKTGVSSSAAATLGKEIVCECSLHSCRRQIRMKTLIKILMLQTVPGQKSLLTSPMLILAAMWTPRMKLTNKTSGGNWRMSGRCVS